MQLYKFFNTTYCLVVPLKLYAVLFTRTAAKKASWLDRRSAAFRANHTPAHQVSLYLALPQIFAQVYVARHPIWINLRNRKLCLRVCTGFLLIQKRGVQMRHFKFSSTVLMALILAGCGGGGSDIPAKPKFTSQFRLVIV